MRAPSKAHNLQSVKIRSMQRLTTGIEPTIARQAVTNAVKPIGGTYQAVTQVKVLSPEMINMVEVDAFHGAEDRTKDGAMVSQHSLYRGLRPWHDTSWKLCELGRSSVFPQRYAATSQQRRGVANDAEEVGLIDITLSLGKPSTWGSDQRCCDGLRTYYTDTQR